MRRRAWLLAAAALALLAPVLQAPAATALVPRPASTGPSVAVVPACGPAAPVSEVEAVVPYSIEVIGRNLGSFVTQVVFNPGPNESQFAAQVQNGSLDQVIKPFPVAPGTYIVGIRILTDEGNVIIATAQFVVPCPPTPPARGTPTPPPPASAPPGVVVTPPPVLNPTLTLTPAVGPPGTVVVARGADFPAGVPVQLGWNQGIAIENVAPVTTDSTGAFTETVLVLPHDELGSRLMTAVSVEPPNSSMFGFASAPFLVVPGEVQPRDFASRR